MKYVFIAAVLIVLGVLGWYLFLKPQSVQAPEPVVENTEEPAVTESVRVILTNDGFFPSTVTVTRGTAVLFVNESDEEMWVASDEHPTHTQYDGTNKDEHCPDITGAVFDQCGKGNSFTFVFNKVGTWQYHNHRNDDIHGTIIVTQ